MFRMPDRDKAGSLECPDAPPLRHFRLISKVALFTAVPAILAPLAMLAVIGARGGYAGMSRLVETARAQRASPGPDTRNGFAEIVDELEQADGLVRL